MGRRVSKDTLESFATHAEQQRARDGNDIRLTSDGQDGAWLNRIIFLPPWRERLPGASELSEEWYGPLTVKEYERGIETWEESREGGGLWDEETEAESHPDSLRTKVKLNKQINTADHQTVTQYVERRASTIPLRELEVFYHVYRSKRSYKRTAKLMGISYNAVKQLVFSLRRRVTNGLPAINIGARK